MKKSIWLKIAVSALLLWALFRFFSFTEVVAHLKAVNPVFFPLCVAGTALWYFLAGLRLYLLWKKLGVPGITLWKVTRSYFVANAIGYWLPSAFGQDAAFIWMNRQDVAKRELLMAVLLNRVFGIAAVVCLGIWGILVVEPSLLGPVLKGLALLSAVAAVTVMALGFSSRVRVFFSELAAFVVRNPLAALETFVLSVLAYVVHALILSFYARSLGAGVPVPQTVLLTAFLQLVTLLPVSFGSLGVQDVSFAAFFARYGGIGIEKAIGISLLLHLFNIAYAALSAFVYLGTDSKPRPEP